MKNEPNNPAREAQQEAYPLTGLSNEQVDKQKQAGKQNLALKPLTRSISRICRDNMLTLFNLINVTIACFIIYTGSYKNLLFLGVALCNTGMGIFQEIRAKRQIDKLTILTNSKVKVIRNGKRVEIEQEEMVLGDLMLLERGDQIPADGLVQQTAGLEVDESQLTGESDPVAKQTGESVMSGSFILSGQAFVETTAVGEDSFVSKLSLEAKQEKTAYSELLRSIKTIIKVLTFVIIPLGVILFIAQLNQSGDLNASILGTAAAMIGMIPEGLVLLTTVALAVGVVNLAKHKVLVKTLPAIETLARVDVLCLDKTGTITSGNLHVTDVLPEAEHTEAELSEAVAAIVFTLNDNNSTSIALKNAFPERPDWQKIETVPFSSARKWSGVTFKNRGSYVIGAPEFVFRDTLSEQKRQELHHYAEKGYRVLCLAKSEHPLPELQEMELIGLILIADELRKEAKDTFRYFKEQGVSIKIISGDNPVTVANVAMQAEIEHGHEYIDMSQVKETDDFSEIVQAYTVFGRVTPHQKKKLVQAYQKEGHTVAMTGDGVNDVLALKESNCSIAMAEGSDATRSVADFVLLNNNFDSMINVLKEGRRVINNIERVSSLYLIKTIYSVVLTIIFTFVNNAYPFQPIQLSPISALTVGIPSFFLALKPNYERIQGQFLKKVLQTAVPAAFCIVSYIIVIMLIGNIFGMSFAETSTMNVLLMGIVCFTALLTVAHPFDFKIKLMIGLLMSAFLCLFLFLGPIFSYTSLLNWGMAIVYVPLAVSVYPFFHSVRGVIMQFVK
ncbi:cation-translocating P-type ATPase [Listeria costaricensis]|uniref:cation-translocating P-type ATPase n=1 Tax=Listeria costaricensis TaxID=2026604 RepID=UPI000C06AE9D|nr:cation-translocating P-type ATPase [Listeria costaricensis]